MTSAEFQHKNPDYAHTNERTPVIKELTGGVRLFIDLSDHVIGLNIIRGRYEEDGLRFIKSVLKPGDVAVDAGAHIGFFAIQMAAMVGPTGRIYAFEPLDPNADLLEASIQENQFADRIVFQRAAVDCASGRAALTFPVETLNTGGAYLLRDGSAPLEGNLQQQIPAVALDALDLRRPVRLIKMDVEGAEPRVVKGAARLLTEDRPTIVSELHPVQLERASGMTAHQFLEQMHALGYQAHYLENGSAGARMERAPADALVTVLFLPRSG